MVELRHMEERFKYKQATGKETKQLFEQTTEQTKIYNASRRKKESFSLFLKFICDFMCICGVCVWYGKCASSITQQRKKRKQTKWKNGERPSQRNQLMCVCVARNIVDSVCWHFDNL